MLLTNHDLKTPRMALIMGLTGYLLIFFTLSCTNKPMPTEMTLDQAIYLTKAWGKRVREPFESATIYPNGDFRGVFGGAEIAYIASKKTLLVEGLVIHDASPLMEDPEQFDEIKRTGDREPYTRGEGYFYIEPTPSGYQKPELTLRKDFTNGAIDSAQFVEEVAWLLEWATHWRMIRSGQVFDATEEELIKEAPEVEARARRLRPRPW